MKPFLIKDLTQDRSVHRTVGLGEEIHASVVHCEGFVKRESGRAEKYASATDKNIVSKGVLLDGEVDSRRDFLSLPSARKPGLAGSGGGIGWMGVDLFFVL